jgi:hypothetical protein
VTVVTDTIRNGVDTEKMFATLDLIKAQPELARRRFAGSTPAGSTQESSANDRRSNGTGRQARRVHDDVAERDDGVPAAIVLERRRA